MAGAERRGRTARGGAAEAAKAAKVSKVEKAGKRAEKAARAAGERISGQFARSGAGRSDSGADNVIPRGWRGLFNPLWCYHGFRMAVAGLTVFGLIMVFSSSTATNAAAGVSPLRQLASQGIFCILGLVAGLICAVLPVVFYRRMGFVMVLIALALQALTFTPLGWSVSGNSGWIKIGGFTFQPAEVIKFALCVWLPAALIAAKARLKRDGLAKAYAFPIAIYGLCLVLVLGGKDLGTCMILFFIGIVAFLIGGFPGKWMVLFVALCVVAVAGMVAISPNRRARLLTAYTGCTDATAQYCYQPTHARYAMASGGLFGVGLGNSREKWSYLPAAHNDFIFAIIGEETGFVGCAIVILLFVTLGWCMVWMALRVKDHYVSMCLMCLTIWLVGQALVNIGVVVGIFPVLGVPMPFISAGGSSMLMCLGAAGVVAGMMRVQPQIRADMSRV